MEPVRSPRLQELDALIAAEKKAPQKAATPLPKHPPEKAPATQPLPKHLLPPELVGATVRLHGKNTWATADVQAEVDPTALTASIHAAGAISVIITKVRHGRGGNTLIVPLLRIGDTTTDLSGNPVTIHHLPTA